VIIDPLSGAPVYRQLADLLRNRITNGEIPPRHPLPSARTLSQEFGLAMGMVNHAFEVLAEEGLIIGVPGRGTHVKDR
jgi:DNA-binding GntR family transcriptional regulator